MEKEIKQEEVISEPPTPPKEETPPQPTKEEIQKHYITKAAAASEVKKQAKLSLVLCLASIGFVFVVDLLASANIILGAIGCAISAGALGFFAFKSKQKIGYLDNTYGLKKVKHKQNV